MSNTSNLGLPLLASAQAQKHVTVNEALVLLDALGQLTLQSVSQNVPPAVFSDGHCFGVPTGASGLWSGHDGDIAIASNGGWVFATPARGWQAFVADEAAPAMFDGNDWAIGAIALSSNNAKTVQRIIEIDHTISGGATSVMAGVLPAQTMVIGVTGRIQTAFSGSATSWRIGIAGQDDRYGSGLGMVQGSWLMGMTSAPQTYYAPTDLIISGENGSLDAGVIRICVHTLSLGLPD